jgi:hypothetical protein
MFPNDCCEKSMHWYDGDDYLDSFEVIGGRDAVDQALLLKCKSCNDEWSRKYQKNGVLLWVKTKEVDQLS